MNPCASGRQVRNPGLDERDQCAYVLASMFTLLAALLAATGTRGWDSESRTTPSSLQRGASTMTAGDNAAMESFWALLQTNVLDRRRWRTRAELEYAIIAWIEHTSCTNQARRLESVDDTRSCLQRVDPAYHRVNTETAGNSLYSASSTRAVISAARSVRSQSFRVVDESMCQVVGSATAAEALNRRGEQVVGRFASLVGGEARKD